MSASPTQLWVWYNPYGLGGVENYLSAMATALKGRGVQPAIAATRSCTGPLEAVYPAGIERLDWTAFQPAFMGETSGDEARARLVSDLVRLQPDVLVLNDCTDFTLGALPLLERLRPWCTLIDVLHIDSPDEAYFTRRAPGWSVLDGVVGTSERALRRLAAAGARVPSRYVRNGVRPHEGVRQPSDGVLRLLFVGRLEQPQKRVLQLPDVAARLVALGRAFRLTIVGDGPERLALEAAIANRDLGGRVTVRGWLPPHETARLYFEHDVLLSLSAYEGFSLTVLEALAAGCVPVCTDLPSLDRTVLQDGVTCRLCPLDRPDAAAELLATLEAEELQRLSRGARERAAALTPEATCDGYLSFVEELRARRPLVPWPAQATALLDAPWDLPRLNPWLPRSHPLRRWVRALFGAQA